MIVPKQLQLYGAGFIPCTVLQRLSNVIVQVYKYNTGVFLCLQDSLAAEIEGTMRKELSVEEECAFQDQRYNHHVASIL